MTLTEGPVQPDEVCDFCHGPAPRNEYPCRDFAVVIVGSDAPEHLMIGAWVACDRCASHVDAGTLEDLIGIVSAERGYAPEHADNILGLWTHGFTAHRLTEKANRL